MDSLLYKKKYLKYKKKYNIIKQNGGIFKNTFFGQQTSPKFNPVIIPNIIDKSNFTKPPDFNKLKPPPINLSTLQQIIKKLLNYDYSTLNHKDKIKKINEIHNNFLNYLQEKTQIINDSSELQKEDETTLNLGFIMQAIYTKIYKINNILVEIYKNKKNINKYECINYNNDEEFCHNFILFNLNEIKFDDDITNKIYELNNNFLKNADIDKIENNYEFIYFRGSFPTYTDINTIIHYTNNFSTYNPILHNDMFKAVLKFLLIHELLNKIKKKIQQNKIIILIGVSLGGAFAMYTLLICRIILGYKNIYAIVFGPPPVLPKNYMEILKSFILCISHELDGVCRLSISNKMTLPNYAVLFYEKKDSIKNYKSKIIYAKKSSAWIEEKGKIFLNILFNLKSHQETINLLFNKSTFEDSIFYKINFPIKDNNLFS